MLFGKYGAEMYKLWSVQAGKPSIEIEIRFHCPVIFWERLKQRLCFTHPLEDVTVSNDRVFSKNQYRLIVGSKELKKYQKKTKFSSLDFSTVVDVETGEAINVRFAISEEIEVGAEEYAKSSGRTSERTRERTSFKFPEFTIDLTKVTYANREAVVEHQLELEWTIDFPTPSVFYETLYKGLKVLFPILHTFYEKEEFAPYLALIAHRGKAPVNIKKEHIDSGMTGYYVTNKLDGVAYSLFSLKECLVLKNSTDCWKIPCVPNSPVDFFEIRCEVVEEGKSVHIFLFDLISYSTHDLALFSRRLELLKELEGELRKRLIGRAEIKIEIKKFRRSGQLTLDLQEIMREIESNKKNNDGLIFQPEDAYIRSPLKWKFVEKISIDLLLQGVPGSNSYRLFYKDFDDCLEAFKHPATQKLVTHTPKNFGGSDCNNLIAEMGGRMVDNKLCFYFMKFRMDKTSPNFKSVVEDTCYDMTHKRTFAILLQQIKGASLQSYERGIKNLFIAFPRAKTILTYSSSPALPVLIANTFSGCEVFAACRSAEEFQETLQKTRKRLKAKVTLIQDTVNVPPHPLVVINKTILCFTCEDQFVVYPRGMLEVLRLPRIPYLSIDKYANTKHVASYESAMKKLTTALFYEQQDKLVLEMMCHSLDLNLYIWDGTSWDTWITLDHPCPTLYLSRSSDGFELF